MYFQKSTAYPTLEAYPIFNLSVLCDNKNLGHYTVHTFFSNIILLFPTVPSECQKIWWGQAYVVPD